MFRFVKFETKKNFSEDFVENIIGDILLTISPIQGNSVNVLGEIKNDEASRINEQKKSIAVLSSISSSEIRKSGDSNAADALKRITGVSISNENSVIVRGLGDRYTETQVNGFNLASPEPDKKVVPLNLFPTALIEKILVYKTYLSNLPGNFAGGNVSIITRSYPNKKILSFKYGSSSNSEFSSNRFMLGNNGDYAFWNLGQSNNSNPVPGNISLSQYTHPDSEQWHLLFNEDRPVSYNERSNLWYQYLGSQGKSMDKSFVGSVINTINPNSNFSINYGDKFNFSDIIEFGFFSSLNYNNKYKFNINEKSKYANTDSGLKLDAFAQRSNSSFSTNAAVVFSTGFKYGYEKQFELDWQSLLTGYTDNNYVISNGYDSNVDDGYFFDESYTEKNITSHRFSVRHKFNETYNYKFQYNFSESILNRPDSKKHYYLRDTVYEDVTDCNHDNLDYNSSNNTYSRDDDDNYNIAMGTLCEGDSRWISWMGNNSWDEGIDASFADANNDGVWNAYDSLYTIYKSNGVYPGARTFSSGGENVNSLKFDNFLSFSNENVLSFGFSIEDRDRRFLKRDFYLDAVNSSFWDDFEDFDPQEAPFGSIFNFENYHGESDGGLILVENVAALARNAYYAENTNSAVYLMLNSNFQFLSEILSLAENLKVISGIRVENDKLKLQPYNPVSNDIFISNIPPFDTVKVDREELYILPSINVTYGDQNKIRFAISKTLARPQFRELAPFEFQEYYSEEPVVGYPGLKSAKIFNYDLRYENYFSSSEVFSGAVFYKKFINPIEIAYIPSNDRAYKTYQNAIDANSYGLEIEFRKNLRFIPLNLGSSSLSFNSIFTKSEVMSDSMAYLFNGSSIKNNASNYSRAMQGQSDIVFNALLNFKHRNSGIDFNLSYNTFSKRINVIGTGDLLDEYEMPYHLVNFKIKKNVFNNVDLSLTLKNLLNEQKKFGYLDGGQFYQTRISNPGRSYSFSCKLSL